MKQLKNQLDVDFIGGQGPLTESEEKALSDFFKNKRQIRTTNVRDTSKKKRETVKS